MPPNSYQQTSNEKAKGKSRSSSQKKRTTKPRNKENIEVKMQQKTGISTWKLDVDEFKAYTGISAEVLADERAHKLFIAEQERLAAGYVPQNF